MRVVGVLTIVATLLASCATAPSTPGGREVLLQQSTAAMTEIRQPALFLPHGGGPCFWIDGPPPFGRQSWEGLRAYLAGVVERLPAPPKAFLVVTAHWEEAAPTVSVNPAPGMIFDYFGFPAHTYELTWPAPGAPELAAKVTKLLSTAGIESTSETKRGLDHGVFIPLKVAFPEAQYPRGHPDLADSLAVDCHASALSKRWLGLQTKVFDAALTILT